MKSRILSVLILVLGLATIPAKAQLPEFEGNKKIRVGIFAPTYLDSLFGPKGYKYKDVPRFAMPGIDFVQGALVALDSMKLEKTTVEARIFDTKSYTMSVPALIKYHSLDSLDLMIGSVKDAEYRQLADFALQKNIPFVSATFPNDGGVTANPFTIIMNSTLKAHCEAIYSYIFQEHSTDKIFLCRKTGDNRVPDIFKQLNEKEGTPLLTMQMVEDSIATNPEALLPMLDSNRKTVFIGASLDENFALGLARACASLEDPYHIKLIGMPNWDGFASLKRRDEVLKDYAINYTAPYYNTKWDEYSKKLTGLYLKKYKTKPSDMAFKGFESVWLFCNLLLKHPTDMMSNLNDKTAKVICEYNFKPVKLKKENTVPDYFENKHLYFLKMVNGEVSRAW